MFLDLGLDSLDRINVNLFLANKSECASEEPRAGGARQKAGEQ